MNIYVTQGHENGIGLEVFLKSCLLLTRRELSRIKLLAFKATVEKTLKTLKLPWHISDSGIMLAGASIDVEWLKQVTVSESFTALLRGIDLCKSREGILFTLPTSKDQFPGYPGHTDFFREHFKNQYLGMFFSSPSLQVLLLSDHVPINQLSAVMTEELIFNRLKTSLEALREWNWPLDRILISGFNPHAGEGGLIGHEDSRISAAIKRLTGHLNLNMSGPLPADTMLLEKRSDMDLLVYVFHDQGLSGFKGVQGFIGSNITLGLPFPRFSPDHGTSFSLFGKNASDYRGCAFALRQALGMITKVSHGKDPGHKGQGSQS